MISIFRIEAEQSSATNESGNRSRPVPSNDPIRPRRAAALMMVLIAGAVAAATVPSSSDIHHAHQSSGGSTCVPVASWVIPGANGGQATTIEALLERGVQAGVVLLGETHDSHEHHRWQLQVITALHSRHPDLVIALEMFPRRVQPALDRWVAGEIDEAEFLRASEWREVWRFDPALYLPIFHFARMNRIPLLAVNVERSLIQAVSAKGYAAIPASEREGVSEPAPAIEAYEDMLLESWRDHLPPDKQQDAALARQDEEFRRFVESQLVWDRAMAQGIADAADQRLGIVVVGLMGSGHVIHGWGVSHQLQQMGRKAPLALLPWDRDGDCATLVPGLADAVFGVAEPPRNAPVARPRLGITLEPAEDGVRIGGVTAGSIAERTGLRKGDLIIEIAGVRPEQAIEVAAAVMRQAPGTWLPIKIQRGSRTLEFVAKFPAASEP
jgi:uncharacterized iron-regulated protein